MLKKHESAQFSDAPKIVDKNPGIFGRARLQTKQHDAISLGRKKITLAPNPS